MPRYSQEDFRHDLASIKGAAESNDVTSIAEAVTRGTSLLRATGMVAQVVVGSNRLQLERAVSRCQSELSGHMSGAGLPAAPAPEPQPESDPQPDPQ
jgi:hypothetical protein